MSYYDQGYADALEKLGFFGPFKRKPQVQAMQPFSMAGLPEVAGGAADQFRSSMGGGRIQNFENFLAQGGKSNPHATLAQQAASAGIKPHAGMPATHWNRPATFGAGIVDAAGDAATAAAPASKGLLSGLSGLSGRTKLLGGLALAGGAAYLWNKHKQNQAAQAPQGMPQQYYGPPAQMPQGAY